MKSEFGIVGLGVMGKSLARNMARHGLRLSLYNRFVQGSEERVAERFIDEFEELKESKGFEDLTSFVDSLRTPRKIMLMVTAGKAVEQMIASITPLLSEGDILIDGGNSHYKDTQRRQETLSAEGIHFLGCGISGGEEGALLGPSLMPGGSEKACNQVLSVLNTIAAKDQQGNACCGYIGPGGSGHFVKMVHNGIEYAEMQLIADVYSLFRKGMGYDPNTIADLFKDWLHNGSRSFLLEITVDILRKKEQGEWLLDQVLDQAGNKGTGSWTTITMAELGIPATTISSALFARYISAFKHERLRASTLYSKPADSSLSLTEKEIHEAYQAARLINHHQGFELLKAASEEYQWKLDRADIARIWTNGCIIRSELMNELTHLYRSSEILLFDPSVVKRIDQSRTSFAKVVSEASLNEIPIPCLSDALQYLSGYIQAEGSANLIQAQRDYFGAHTYQRKDDPEGPPYHTNWKP